MLQMYQQNSRVEEVKSDRQGVGGGIEKKGEVKKTKTIGGKVNRNEKRFKKDKITYVDKPTHRVG